MISRERVIKSLEHQPIDRLPIDVGGIYNLTSLHKDAYSDLIKYLGYDNLEIKIGYFNSQTVIVDEKIRKRFKADCYPLIPEGTTEEELNIQLDEEGKKFYIDEFGLKWKSSGLYYDPVESPLERDDIKSVKNLKFPDLRNQPRRFDKLKKEAVKVYQDTDYATVLSGPLGGGIYVPCTWFLGYESFFIKMITDRELVLELLNQIVQYHLEWWDIVLSEIGEFVQVVVLSDDLGSQEAPLMSPEMYRDIIKPFHEKVITFIKNKANVKVVFHCDGAIWDFIPDFIDMGVDALNPIQVSAKGMDNTSKLKQEFGDQICFWGATCGGQNILPNSNPKEIEREVKKRIDDLKSNGGLVLSSIHNIQKDVPPENIVAFYDALFKYSQMS